MKCLFCDAIEFGAKKANNGNNEHMTDCLVVFVTFEVRDGNKQIRKLLKEIRRIARKIKTKNLVFAPFCHLSSDLLDSEKTLEMIDICRNELAGNFDLLVSEFGVEKGLLLNVRLIMDNIKFRSF